MSDEKPKPTLYTPTSKELRDARLPVSAGLVGPETLPADAFTRAAADRMLALP